MTPSPGPRVAVTRDESRNGPLSLALRRHRLEPVVCRVIAHLPTPDPDGMRLALERLDRFHWVVVSSVRAVETMARARAPWPLPREPRWAAVGTATQAALARHGVRASVVPREAGAEHLVSALREADTWPGRRVLVPRAERGHFEVAEALRGLGAAVTEVAAYRTVACPPEEIRAAWQAAAALGVVFASPSAATAFVHAVGSAALAGLPAVIAIGATTATALRGLDVIPCVAPRTEFDAVAHLCSRLLSTVLPEAHR